MTKDKKKSGKILIGIIIFFFICIIASPSQEVGEVDVKTQEEAVEYREIEAIFEQEFMAGCMENGTTFGDCKCMYDFMHSRYSLVEFVEISNNLEAEESQDAMLDAVLSCMDN